MQFIVWKITRTTLQQHDAKIL